MPTADPQDSRLHRAARWTYLGSGMSHPQFRATLGAISPAALARIEGDRLSLDGLLFLRDGSRHWAASRSGPVADAERIGREAGAELKAAAGDTYRDRLQ